MITDKHKETLQRFSSIIKSIYIGGYSGKFYIWFEGYTYALPCSNSYYDISKLVNMLKCPNLIINLLCSENKNKIILGLNLL